MTDLFAKCMSDGGYFGAFRAGHDSYFTQPKLEGVPGPHMRFRGRDVVMWAINSYLGLADRREIWEAAREELDRLGPGSPMGSRMLTGNTEEHVELEKMLAAFCGKQAAILFNYGYLGVLGTLSALVGKDDTIIIDSLSHASMIDATVLASAGRRFRAYKHNDMEDLEAHLAAASGRAAASGTVAAGKASGGGILIVTEGVFGMKGNLARLADICRLKESYGARLFVDDAHGFGVMGPTGQGTGEHAGVQDSIDIYFGTFAKAFAAIGGVSAGDEQVVEYIRYNARTNVFAKAIPHVYVAAIRRALQIVKAEPGLRERMWKIARLLQDGLKELGYDTGDTASPITPVYVASGDEQAAMRMISMLREDYGIFVSGVSFPVVPRGVVLFRMIPTAAHSEEDVARTLDAFRLMRDRLSLDLSSKPSLVNR